MAEHFLDVKRVPRSSRGAPTKKVMDIKPYINKKSITATAIVAVVLAAAIGYAILKKTNNQLSPEQKIELEFINLIDSNLENWALYEKTSDDQYKKFGNDPSCGAVTAGDADFIAYEQKAKAGDAYRLDLTSGAYVLYTPNYQNWDNQKLFSFGVKEMRVCSQGWLIPLQAYPDKIVWGNITCFGVESAQSAMCQKITRIVMGHFSQ